MTIKVLFDATPALLDAIRGVRCVPSGMMQGSNTSEPKVIVATAPRVPASAAAPVADPAPVEAPESVPTAETAPEPAAAPVAAPTPEYKEQPEDVLPLLMQRFGIPEKKEDRDDDQKQLAKQLNKGLQAILREVTKDKSAKSIADLRTEADKQRFIELALLLTRDANTGEFSVNAF